ncbi:hypothetical protein QJS10_CPA10g01525 [Acorus calamus]|uniref:Uncharacterized protein n=1 Tax=Acorus calamus TaxID=4465 RepID=A0AAV9DYU0_ACOCL|nr:hypothetical protein QJS10_CPA10g01525 [Acorus calamus]
MADIRRRRNNGAADYRDGDWAGGQDRASALTRAVDAVFAFVRLAEFEILFFLFFFIAFIMFKHLTSRPEYNQVFVKKPGGNDFFP